MSGPHVNIAIYNDNEIVGRASSYGYTSIDMGAVSLVVQNGNREVWRTLAIEALSLFAATPEEAKAALDAIAAISGIDKASKRGVSAVPAESPSAGVSPARSGGEAPQTQRGDGHAADVPESDARATGAPSSASTGGTSPDAVSA